MRGETLLLRVEEMKGMYSNQVIKTSWEWPGDQAMAIPDTLYMYMWVY